MNDIRTGTCPLCGHPEIIEAIPADFGDKNLEHVQAVTYEPRMISSARSPSQPHGLLRLYVCRRCGCAQTFADAPGAIPIGERYKTRLIGPK